MTTDPLNVLPAQSPADATDPPFRCCRAGDPTAGYTANVDHGNDDPTAPTAPTVLPCVLAPGANLPRRGRPDDAGLDLATPRDFLLHPNTPTTIDTGVAVAIPPGHCGQLWGRSSLGSEGILIGGGLLDSNYRGPIGVTLINAGQSTRPFKAGDRIAQLVVTPYLKMEPMMIDRLSATDRGAAGWGSSGK